MTNTNFARSQPHILSYEGKFSNHKDDPGGRTYEGITQTVWDGYCENNGLPQRQLTANTGSWKDWAKHRDAIYRQQYWNAIKGDKLPDGVDFVVYDGAVNSGVNRSGRWLQNALRMNHIDGVIGEATIAAANAHPDKDRLIAAILDGQRLPFLKALKTWPTFGVGWGRRVAAVKKTGQAWAEGSVGPAPTKIADAGAKGWVEDAKTPSSTAPADAAIGTGGGATTIGVAIDSAKDTLLPFGDSSDLIKTIVTVLVVAGIAITVGGFAYRWYVTRKAKKLAEALS